MKKDEDKNNQMNKIIILILNSDFKRRWSVYKNKTCVMTNCIKSYRRKLKG